MCGIAGIIARETGAERRETALRQMCTAMQHRGPDDLGWVSRGEATIGGCRLAIFDPANGHQPMTSPDGRWTLVFNGAIYNHRELRQELVASGWAFRTHCDTEVLLAAIATWGQRCLDRLRGMFAFAAWDHDTRALFAARDPFGIKPLYFAQRGGEFVFASELNALLASGMVPAEIDAAAVADYLAWFAVPAPRTIYRNIVSLRPGECLRWHDGVIRVEQAWSFAAIPAAPAAASYDDFVAQLRLRLEDTIRAHQLADVPVGAFLSGGLDSAAIVGLMARTSGAALRTFSIGFEDPAYSETAAAEETARHFGVTHHTHVLTGAEVAADLNQLLGATDQPTGDGINTYYASKVAKLGGVTVALSGLGGDELFGGYPSFTDTPRLSRILPWWHRAPGAVRRGIVARLQRGDTRRRKLADVLQHATNIQELGALQRRVFSDTTRARLLNPEARDAIAALTPFHPELDRLAPQLAGAGQFEIVSAWELRTYMADVLLRDSDVMSMRHSLELRVPFIDRPLIEWLWRQPAKALKGNPKTALYDAVADLLPPGLRHRRKRGFTLPFAVWMKRELRPFLEDTFSDASIGRAGLFAPTAVRELWHGFLANDDSREWSRVWSLAVLIAFANRQAPAAPRPRVEAVSVSSTPASPSRRTLLMAPEIFASEGGIPRILQLYLRALCETHGKGRVRLLALNDAESDGVRALAGFDGAVENSAACNRSKSRFVREALTLARGCDTIVCGHIRQLSVAWLARRFNPSLRYFLVAHGIEVWRRFSALERTALRGATRILCVSDFTRRELLKNCPLPENRVVVLHNALDPCFELTAGKPLAHCPPTILVVTRITFADRYKGVQHLIEAMPAILRAIPEARLRIIGRGDDVDRLQRLSRWLGVGGAVDFLGFVDDRAMTEELQTCRLFALPSRKEGFGLVFLEAMAHGRPCLGADAGGIPEVITPESGLLVPYGDIEAIATAAVSALHRPWNQDKILARAKHFSYDAFRTRLNDMLAA